MITRAHSIWIYGRLQRIIALIKTHLSQTSPQLPNWLYVNVDAIPGILDVLTYWSTIGPSTMTVRKMLSLRQHKSPSKNYLETLQIANMSPAYKQAIENNYKELREEIIEYYDNTNPEGLKIGWARLGDAGAQQMKQNREQMIEGMFRMRIDGNGPAKMQDEQLWYEMIGVFIPPQALWTRHPGFKNSNKILKWTDEPIPQDMQKKVCLGLIYFILLSVLTLSQLKKHVEETWKPNPTLIVWSTYYKKSLY